MIRLLSTIYECSMSSCFSALCSVFILWLLMDLLAFCVLKQFSTRVGLFRLCSCSSISKPSPFTTRRLLLLSSPLPLSPHLPDFRRRRSHDAAKISFNVAFSCCPTAACCNHGSCNLYFPSYQVSFSHTLNIVHRATHSATVS